jgi:hypothetical protein
MKGLIEQRKEVWEEQVDQLLFQLFRVELVQGLEEWQKRQRFNTSFALIVVHRGQGKILLNHTEHVLQPNSVYAVFQSYIAGSPTSHWKKMYCWSKRSSSGQPLLNAQRVFESCSL